MELYILGFILILFVVGLFFFRPKKNKISNANLQKSTKDIQSTKDLDPNHALMESHKIFVAGVATLYPNQKATAAQTLNKVCKRFPNEKAVWRLHRLRNQAAHKTNFKVFDKTAEEARREFTRALRSLG